MKSAKTIKNESLISTGIVRLNAVSSPSAQSPSLCESGTIEDSDFIQNCNRFFMANNEPQYIKAPLWLLFQEGLRISEVLNIRSGDVKYGCRILIRGLKGSNDRIVTPVRYIDFWRDFRTANSVMLDSLDRFFLYRICRKYGLYYSNKHSQRLSVTHSFRHSLIESLDRDKIKLETVQKHVGHKSIRSTKYYTNGT